MNTTPVSLLERMCRSESGPAWQRFVDLYTPLIVYWVRRFGLQDADAADLVQDVFVALMRDLPRFEVRPGKRFRGWLWTLTANKCRQRLRVAPGPAGLGDHEPPTPDAAAEVADAEYQQYLIQRALQLMQSEFEPATWQACWEFVVHERPAAEVAAELGITPNAVYLAKARVLRRLRQELAGLMDE